MRRQLLEEDYSRVHFDRLPCVEAFKTCWREIVRGFVIILVMAVAFYLIFVYLATYLQQVDSISAARALTINTISMIFLLIITPFAGMLADRFGRSPCSPAALRVSWSCPGLCFCCWTIPRQS
jgi:MHS family proline/betaine transporter-like MFS transporter